MHRKIVITCSQVRCFRTLYFPKKFNHFRIFSKTEFKYWNYFGYFSPIFASTAILVAISDRDNWILHKLINNYWMRSSRIWGIIKAEVCVICRSRRLRQITQTEALIIPHILREPNSIIVLLFICICKLFPWRSRPFVFSRIWHKQHKLLWRHNVV